MPRRRWRHAIVALDRCLRRVRAAHRAAGRALHRSREAAGPPGARLPAPVPPVQGARPGDRPHAQPGRARGRRSGMGRRRAGAHPRRARLGHAGSGRQAPPLSRTCAGSIGRSSIAMSRCRAISRTISSSRSALPPERIAQIYNGVDTDRFRPSRGGRPAIPGCPFGEPDHWLVGTVGRMEAIKDPLNLARAFVRAQRARAGGGEAPAAGLRRRWRAARRGRGSCWSRPGSRDRVWFAGERADVPEIMRGLDCFVLPSLAEGVSNTILEAMASGLPVVATRVGGNSELIESGMTGTLVPPANSDALAQAMLGYFSDRSTARRHAKAAHRVVEDAVQPHADGVRLRGRVRARAGRGRQSGPARRRRAVGRARRLRRHARTAPN